MVPQPNEIEVSIVILTHNQLNYTKICLESIRSYTPPGTYEIIVVDNASTDETKAWLRGQKDIILIDNIENAGFPKGCNQGIGIARGKNILLLNNDVIVTSNWLNNMLAALDSSAEVGAVGCVTNSASYYQSIPITYQSIDEMHLFAARYNVSDSRKWEKRLKLVGFCMLIKREVIERIGLLDEIFSPGNFEDDDYSFRIIEAGYKLILCKDTFIHHFGSVSFKQKPEAYRKVIQVNAKKFESKWGFSSQYSTMIRNEIIELINNDVNRPIRVLEVGCACGATLLEIKNRYPNAELYGIELNEGSAKIAAAVANVRSENVEKEMSYPEGFFDYIIFADVLEHLIDPWTVVSNAKRYLKADGKMLVSLPNVMHYSVLKQLIDGRWSYTDAGLLDRTHVRFFTKYEMVRMFSEAGFGQIEVGAVQMNGNKEDQAFISKLVALSSDKKAEEMFTAYQYLFRLGVKSSTQRLKEFLRNFDGGELGDEQLDEVTEYLIANPDDFEEINRYILTKEFATAIVNQLVVSLYNRQHYDYLLPLLQSALSVDEKRADTLFNLANILDMLGEYELSLQYISQIPDPTDDVRILYNELQSKILIANG